MNHSITQLSVVLPPHTSPASNGCSPPRAYSAPPFPKSRLRMTQESEEELKVDSCSFSHLGIRASCLVSGRNFVMTRALPTPLFPKVRDGQHRYPGLANHQMEHGVLPPDHPSIPYEFSGSGVDLVLNATERRVVPFHDSAPCHFAALPPGHGAQNKSRSKEVTLASNCLPDFFITCGGGVTTQRSPEASGRRRSLGEASLHFGFPPRRTEGPVEATTRGFRRVKKGIS